MTAMQKKPPTGPTGAGPRIIGDGVLRGLIDRLVRVRRGVDRQSRA